MPISRPHDVFDCRPGCGACCIAPSIARPLPNMPHGKPAGVRCANLDDDDRCRLWGGPEFPSVCRGFRASPEICGETRSEAMAILTVMEAETAPSGR